jgi:Lysine methyltransferase
MVIPILMVVESQDAVDERADDADDEYTSPQDVDVDDPGSKKTEVVQEDDWGLAMDFHLFAQHEEYAIPLPRTNDDNKHNNQKVLKLLCVESLTPLDMLQLSTGEYDATGHCAWTAAFFLLPYIVTLQTDFGCFTNQRILELGCGTGIAGWAVAIVAAPAHIELTDHDPEVLTLCRRNGQLNQSALTKAGSTYAVRSLTWGEELLLDSGGGSGCLFDTVLATDVLYDISMLPPLLQSAYQALGRSSSSPSSLPPSSSCCYYFVLSHVPRACYKTEHAPVVADLDQYIIDQAQHYGFALVRVYRPPAGGGDVVVVHQEQEEEKQKQDETTTTLHDIVPAAALTTPSLLRDCRSMRQMRDIGAAIFVFQKLPP